MCRACQLSMGNLQVESTGCTQSLLSNCLAKTYDTTVSSRMLQGQEVDAMHRSQAMAEAGDVDGSMVCAQQAETYKKQHDTLQTQLTAPERVMTVCEVCGVFINSTDNDQRRQVRKPMTEVSAT